MNDVLVKWISVRRDDVVSMKITARCRRASVLAYRLIWTPQASHPNIYIRIPPRAQNNDSSQSKRLPPVPVAANEKGDGEAPNLLAMRHANVESTAHCEMTAVGATTPS
jgi:hypothetical protein